MPGATVKARGEGEADEWDIAKFRDQPCWFPLEDKGAACGCSPCVSAWNRRAAALLDRVPARHPRPLLCI